MMKSKIIKTFAFAALAGASTSYSMAADFSFDRPGAGFGTGITPVGRLAWEQGLPSAAYQESTDAAGEKSKKVKKSHIEWRHAAADRPRARVRASIGLAGPCVV